MSALEFYKLPFTPKRLYCISEVPNNESRGGHAHKELSQAFICLTGGFDLILDNGQIQETVTLQAGDDVTIIGPRVWRELHNFKDGSHILVLADHEFSEDDYIRDKDAFLKSIGSEN